MGGTTITIQEDKLTTAIDRLIEERKQIWEEYQLFLDSVTVLEKKKKYYHAFGDKGIEAEIGLAYPQERFEKKFVIFAHFGK